MSEVLPAPTKERTEFPVLRVLSPFVLLGATWAADKLLTVAFEAVTGRKPPDLDDPQVSFRWALGWGVVTAATSAVIHVTIERAAQRKVPAGTGDAPYPAA